MSLLHNGAVNKQIKVSLKKRLLLLKSKFQCLFFTSAILRYHCEVIIDSDEAGSF